MMVADSLIPAKTRTVLIVEDDPGMVELLVHCVASQGFRVLTAGDGLEALDKIRRLKPDIAVMDLMLPRYGGIEVLLELRLVSRVPIVVVTGRYNTAEIRDMILRQPNVVGFLGKPFAMEDLINNLHQTLGTGPSEQ